MDDPGEHCVSEETQSQRTTHFPAPFISNVPTRPIYRDRKYVSACVGPGLRGGGGGWEVGARNARGYRVFFLR